MCVTTLVRACESGAKTSAEGRGSAAAQTPCTEPRSVEWRLGWCVPCWHDEVRRQGAPGAGVYVDRPSLADYMWSVHASWGVGADASRRGGSVGPQRLVLRREPSRGSVSRVVVLRRSDLVRPGGWFDEFGATLSRGRPRGRTRALDHARGGPKPCITRRCR